VSTSQNARRGKDRHHQQCGDSRPARQIAQGKTGEDHQEQSVIAGEAVTGRVLGRNTADLGHPQRIGHHQGRAGSLHRQSVTKLVDHQCAQQHHYAHCHQLATTRQIPCKETSGQDQPHTGQHRQIEQPVIGDGHQIGPQSRLPEPAVNGMKNREVPLIPGTMSGQRSPTDGHQTTDRQRSPTDGHQTTDQIAKQELAHGDSPLEKGDIVKL